MAGETVKQKIVQLVFVLIVYFPTFASSLRCLYCTGVVKPADCDTLTNCGSHEKCYVDAYVTAVGSVRYDLGCRDTMFCRNTSHTRSIDTSYAHNENHSINPYQDNHNNTGYISTFKRSRGTLMCSECCSGNLCSSGGCGNEGYMHPRGPICYSCPYQQTPDDCSKITMCGQDEVCMLVKYTSAMTNESRYLSKCEHEKICNDKLQELRQLPSISIVGKRQIVDNHDIDASCNGKCCISDLCNMNCQTFPSQTTLKTEIPTSTPDSTLPSTQQSAISTTPVTWSVKTVNQLNSTSNMACPSGWIMYGSSCYLFKTNRRANWNDANRYCGSKMSHLAIIETDDEFLFLMQQLDQRINTSHLATVETSVWLAGRDANNEGTWEWYYGFTHTYKQLTYTHWGHDEPDAGNGEHDEDCMCMVGRRHFAWADFSCSKKMFYVCERSLLEQTQTPNPTETTNCPPGWVFDHGSCYFFYMNGRSSWSKANHDCSERYAHLAVIDTEKEFTFLRQQLDQRIDPDSHVDTETSAWVAGIDSKNEGHWEWYNGFTNTYQPLIYENWGPLEPDSGRSAHDEDCMSMLARKNFKWADFSCREKMFYVCEQRASTLMTLQAQNHVQTNGAGCSSGWIMNNGSCYFLQTNTRLSWHDANLNCSRQQAHLVIIESAEENRFISQAFIHQTSSIISHNNNSEPGLWVGGTDVNQEGNWEWIDGFRHISKHIQGYNNWHHGQPIPGYVNLEKDCMFLHGHIDLEWYSHGCGQHMFFICERSVAIAAPLVG